jgi:excisionase family DNA binding protein
MKLLTVRECAQMLRVSPGCVYQLVSQNKLPHLRVGCGRGRIRIPEEALAEFLRSNLVDANTVPSRSSQDKPRGRGRLFKHLDGERLRAAWQQQGVRVDLQDGRSVRPSE